MSKLSAAAVLATAISLCAAAPAFAGDAACVWRGLPEAGREALLAKYPNGADAAVHLEEQFTPAVLGAAILKCTQPAKDEYQQGINAGIALGGYLGEFTSEKQLISLGFTHEKLDAAFRQLDKARLRVIIDAAMADKLTDDLTTEFHGQVTRVGGEAAMADETQASALVLYVYGRGAREIYEPLF
jgi:hypothetical protein